MIKIVSNKKELMTWIKFTKQIYPKSSHYVPPLYRVLHKELSQQIFLDKKYTALLCLKNNQIVGRLLYTYQISKKEKQLTCYFSFFDSINDYEVVKEMFNYVKEDMSKNNCHILEGTYCPYDSDTRRGILVDAFDLPPMIFNSYNYEYYPKLLEQYGFIKGYDTVALKAYANKENQTKLERISKLVKRRLPNLKVESVNLKNPTKHINDIISIMNAATTEMNFSATPNIEFFNAFIKQFKLFLVEDYICIIYDNDIPIGFGVTLPNYNQLFKKVNGKRNYLKLILGKRKITECRGMLQYIIPEYQKTGVIAVIFEHTINALIKHKCHVFEASTILEENLSSSGVFSHFNGEIYKRYRIYKMEV